MPKDLIERTDAPPATLDDLAQQIDAEYDAAQYAARTAIERAIQCGRLLVKAKANVPHGEWLPWLRTKTKVPARTAQRWMRFSEDAEALLAKSATVADLTFAEADRLLTAPPSEVPKPKLMAREAEEKAGSPRQAERGRCRRTRWAACTRSLRSVG